MTGLWSMDTFGIGSLDPYLEWCNHCESWGESSPPPNTKKQEGEQKNAKGQNVKRKRKREKRDEKKKSDKEKRRNGEKEKKRGK